MGWCNLTGLDVLWRIGEAQVDTVRAWTCCSNAIFFYACSSMSMYKPFSGVLEGVCGERYSEYKTDTRCSATENILDWLRMFYRLICIHTHYIMNSSSLRSKM